MQAGAPGRRRPAFWPQAGKILAAQELVEYIAAHLMLPIGGFFTAIFAGWIVSRAITREELGDRFPAWTHKL